MQKTTVASWTVSATRHIDYEILESPNLLDPENPDLAALPYGSQGGGRRLVVIDEAVQGIFGDRIRGYFAARNKDMDYLTLPGGDEHKTLDQVVHVASRLNEIGTRRAGTPPIAIGGGVVQDVVGMAAGLYRRGIPYVRVPTTLLGQIDGSVSAKNGVNFEGHRNRLGTFAPPPRTLIDRTLIATLPRRQISSGMGEIIKMALIKDARLFDLLEAYGPDLLTERLQDTGIRTSAEKPGQECMHRAIAGMAEELQKNLWETDLRRIVDYGHTFSPAVEMRALPEILHGEAVAMGCVFGAVLSARRGILRYGQLERIIKTVRSIGLEPSHPLFGDPEILNDALSETVRHRDNHQHITLLRDVGITTFVDDLTTQEVAGAAATMVSILNGKSPLPDVELELPSNE
ncbi:sedoheptulose 7-phosphate cyclase [Streptomyces sp. NBC_01264]|uniref:sedoheptulose 7-phosphate cyclase n=1 Tax=Streptomyces sp. NBC_01264 TaxID=2903804 RepID=UPI0022504C48|nr:sedoheptulose 7-phosphate cyclase [Streptomyces sp. NBC_01264]MCX4784390.1 sedoheptulose 7-phosphate cyclase [Streptomyces sp. NBC_01264]